MFIVSAWLLAMSTEQNRNEPSVPVREVRREEPNRQFSQNRGFRGRGRGQGPKVIPGPVALPLPRPPPGAKPVPKDLATTATPPKNDPMWIDFEDHGFVGLTPYRGENTFATTYEGFIPIVDREYDLIGSADRTFTKFVSRAMWMYKNTQ
ncbi:hypothetical protein L798_12440 [Zootermopsis nevadensis]|uniref:Uncharacterized protein n=1 Tax=Zootermopsis nevadensis TaxID=136037 RepID=A0A067R5S4_ZOONE|nr:hypothetical protein L798_12440 [Zootermopsis nevadensis]